MSQGKKNQRTLALILIGIGAIWLACNFCVVPVSFAGIGDIGRSIGEWGSSFGRTMGDFGRTMGEWGRDFGQAMGEMGRDFGQGMGSMGRVIGSVFTSICASLLAFGLIGAGLLLILRRTPAAREAEPVRDERKAKRDDLV